MAYEDLYGNPVVATTDDLSQNPWINNFATQGALTGLQYLSGTLSKLKNAAFGFAGGIAEGDPLQAVKELGNLIPFSDTVGLTNTPGGILTEKPVEGRDLLRKMGAVGAEDNWGNFTAGLALDILGDPLNFFTGPAVALTKAGKAAEKTGTLPSTILGRIKAAGGPLGGWIGIKDRPWYAEALGFGPQQTVATLGTGKIGESIASGIEKGVSAATKFNIPGTEFSPIGALRSAFQRGSGNTGYGPIVDEFGGGYGKTNVAQLTEDMATASRKAAFPTVELQSKAYNDLLMTGMAEEDIAPIMNRAAVTQHELLGRIKLPPNLTPQQEAIVKQYANDFSQTVQPILRSEQQAARELGIQVEDTTSPWGHRYLNRAQAGKGNATATSQYQRTKFISELPGGQDQFEQLAINPQFSGFANRKVAGQAYDGVAIQSQIDQNAKSIAQEIMAEANQQIPVMRQYGLKVPQRAIDIATNADGAADDLARETSNYLARLQPEVVDKGMFYRQDLGTNAMAYGTNFAARKAVRTGALNVLAKEGKDIDLMLTKATNASDVVNLKAAIDELGMTGAEAQLVNRIPGMNSVDDLASRAVPRKLVQKLYEEVNPGEAAPEGFLSKLSSAFRYGVTIPFPANFVRNWTGELADISIAGGNPVRGLKDTVSWYNKTLPAVSEIEAVHAAKGASGNMVTYSIRGKPGTEKQLLSDLQKLVTRLDPYDPANVTISDIISPAYKRAAEAEKAGIITGVLGTDQTRALLGTGMVGGERMLNYAPVPSMRSTKEIVSDFFKPVTSEAARTKMEITPLRELAGVPTGQPPSTMAGKAVAMVGDKVVDPFRGYMGAMETAHAFQNKATRHQQIRQLLDQGYTMEGAAKRVLTTQRNYENLTDFERKFMRNVVPFYNFSKQNLISQADMMSRNPGRYNAVLSLINSGRSEDSFVPSWASSGTAIPLPGAPEGQQRFLGNLGLPIEDEAIGALGALLSGHPIEAVRRAASSSNPLMKVPYEMATGRQIFSGRDLQDLKPSPVVSAVLGDNQFSRGLTQALTGTPYSRAFSTVDRLANSPEKGVLTTLLNLATGIRTVDVDQDRAAGIAARQTVERLLKESGNFKSREMVYLKPELRGQEETLSPEVQQLMQYHQQLLKRAQDAAKLKALEQANR